MRISDWSSDVCSSDLQRQINYTRSNESEADRIGIRTMARSGYDPEAMAQMFERMQALERSNQGGAKQRTPDYLRSHPVTTTRIAEAKTRAAKMERSEEHTTELQSLMRISYAVFCLDKKN